MYRNLKAKSKKKLNYSWHRCRRSLKSQRDEQAFRHGQNAQQIMQKLDHEGKINLYYFDGSGFSATPCVPYAWQQNGKILELPSKRSKRLNVLGFMAKNNDSFFHTVEGRTTSEHIIAAFHGFAEYYAPVYATEKIPAIIVIDNASVHTSHAFLAQHETWMAQGLGLHYLPTYSPELNLIEILWRKIKYQWLPLDCYLSYANLKKSVLAILDGFGKKYLITFV